MQSLTQRLANPTRFMELSARVLPWLVGAAAVILAYGLYLSFFVAPPDYQQGETVRIMYIHVPSAWLGMAGYALIAVSAFGLLVFRHPLADVSAKAAAPLGAVFTFLALVTGSLWGRPTWGTYWVWDARLTSVLILFFLYLGLIALDPPSRTRRWRQAHRRPRPRRHRHAADHQVLGRVGQHAASGESIFRAGGPTIDPSILRPLLVMTLGFTVLFAALHLKRCATRSCAAASRPCRWPRWRARKAGRLAAAE